jgi:hypothetical protein
VLFKALWWCVRGMPQSAHRRAQCTRTHARHQDHAIITPSLHPPSTHDQVFERECTVFPVATGTAANALALASCCKPWSAVLCHAGSHIHVDEAGATEAAGCGVKLIPIEGANSKLTSESITAQYDATTRYGDYGGVPAAVSVSQVPAPAHFPYTGHPLFPGLELARCLTATVRSSRTTPTAVCCCRVTIDVSPGNR